MVEDIKRDISPSSGSRGNHPLYVHVLRLRFQLLERLGKCLLTNHPISLTFCSVLQALDFLNLLFGLDEEGSYLCSF